MSKDYLDKWEERAKKNTEIIEQQQTKKMKNEFKKLNTNIQHIIVKKTIKSFLWGFMIGMWVVIVAFYIAI